MVKLQCSVVFYEMARGLGSAENTAPGNAQFPAYGVTATIIRSLDGPWVKAVWMAENGSLWFF